MIWPFRRERNSAMSRESVAAIVGSYLSTIPAEGDWEDEDVHRRLVDCGHDPSLAWEIVGLVPTFAGRIVLSGMGVRVSDTVVFVDANGTKRRSERLSRYVPYAAVSSQADSIIAHPNAVQLGAHSAELGAVYQLITQGSDPKNLVLTPLIQITKNG